MKMEIQRGPKMTEFQRRKSTMDDEMVTKGNIENLKT